MRIITDPTKLQHLAIVKAAHEKVNKQYAKYEEEYDGDEHHIYYVWYGAYQ